MKNISANIKEFYNEREIPKSLHELQICCRIIDRSTDPISYIPDTPW